MIKASFATLAKAVLTAGLLAFVMSCVGSIAPAQLNQVTVVGAVTPGNCTKFLSTLQLADAGSACGGGGGGVTIMPPVTANDCAKLSSTTLILDAGAPCGTVIVSGTPTTGNCVSWASATSIQDVGAPCGTGGGAVTSVFTRTGAVVAAANDYNFNQLAGTANLATQVAGVLAGANGGTGVANTGKSITLGGALTTTGAGAITMAMPATAATYTFPTASATLLSTAALALSATPLTTTGTGAPTLAFPNAARTFTFPQTNSVLLSNADAVATTAPGNPTAPGTGTGRMLGLGASCAITPTNSTRVLFMITSLMNDATDVFTTTLKFGTGTAPANGAAQSGTTLGNSPSPSGAGVAVQTMMPQLGVATGLTAGTAYWFDLFVNNTGTGAVGISGVTCVAVEL